MSTPLNTIIIAAAILFTLGTTSCIQGDDLATPASPVNQPVDFTNASWKITYFWDSDHDETGHYNSFVFTFGSDGAVSAVSGSSTYLGTWTDGHDDSTAKLILSFTAPPDLEELSDDWHVLEWSDSVIRLRDVSGGNGGTDLLTFTKI